MNEFRLVLLTFLAGVVLSGPLLAQSVPYPGTTVPADGPAPKTTGVVIDCLMKNGQPRPYACEFRVTSFAVKGNGMAVRQLRGFDPGKPVVLTLSVASAGRNSLVSGDIRQLAFPVMMTVVRSNKPTFPTAAGYPILFYPKQADALVPDAADSSPYVLTKEPLSINMTQTQGLLVWMKFLAKPGPDGQLQFVDNETTAPTLTGTLSILNPATAQALRKQKGISGLGDLSEWWATVTFRLVP